MGIQHLDFEFKGRHNIGYAVSPQDLVMDVLKDVDFFEESGGGVTFTGGEPLMQSEFLQEVSRLLKKQYVHLALDTSAYVSAQIFQKSIENIDLVLFDIKQMNPKKHFLYTGVDLNVILKNLNLLSESHKEVLIRYPMIPGMNDDEENLQKMTSYLKKLKTIDSIQLLPYHQLAKGKYEKLQLKNRMPDIVEPSARHITEVKQFLQEEGFQVIIG